MPIKPNQIGSGGETRAQKRIVIIGGGFAGIAAARALKRAYAEVVLIDRRNHHIFQPLLYQVATGVLAPSEIAAPTLVASWHMLEQSGKLLVPYSRAKMLKRKAASLEARPDV